MLLVGELRWTSVEVADALAFLIASSVRCSALAVYETSLPGWTAP